jgi:hypothetical protein
MFSEIDLASRGINRRASLKEESHRFLAKMAHPPSGESPLKIRTLVQLMAIGNLISKSANSSVCCLFVYYLQMLTKTLRTNIEAVSNGAVNFQPQNFVGAMNAVRC